LAHVDAGTHTIGVEILRAWMPDLTPHQYVDDFVFTSDSTPAVPEPGSLLLLGTAAPSDRRFADEEVIAQRVGQPPLSPSYHRSDAL
jgi:hypothetical protein